MLYANFILIESAYLQYCKALGQKTESKLYSKGETQTSLQEFIIYFQMLWTGTSIRPYKGMFQDITLNVIGDRSSINLFFYM